MTQQRILAIGVFDLFHIGHLRYLQYARSRGDYLVVLVAPDALAFAYKQKRPFIIETQRMEIVRSMACVNQVELLPATLEDADGVAQWMPKLNINRVIVGSDWADSERWRRLIPVLARLGIEVEFCPYTSHISTTMIAAAIRANA